MQKDTRPAPSETSATDRKPPRFLDGEPPRRVPLSGLRTDDEARLAAEIEKLR